MLFNPFVQSQQDASRGIRNIVKLVRNNEADFAVFPDALPEYTRRLGKKHSYIKSTLFGREAALHEGPYNFPKLMRKDVLPYYVYVRNGKLNIKILDPIEYTKIKTELPKAIETTIDGMYQQWMLWHFLSFFYRNG